MAAAVMPLEESLKAQALRLGFDLVGITTLGAAETIGPFEQWLENGFAGNMRYLQRQKAKRRDTRLPARGCKSAVVVALNYDGTQPSGNVARYARGQDYHEVILEKLRLLHGWLTSELGYEVKGKPYVDTGPILERDLARRAGLGWFGKNTTLINPGLGSYFFIGSLLLDLELEPDSPFTADHCGSCRRCIDACPTQAFPAERVLDATRCISYLTIELRGSIPLALRTQIGDLLFGCDICQEVCPWNVKFSRPPAEHQLKPAEPSATLDAVAILAVDENEFNKQFGGSALSRAQREGLARNAAVVLGNAGSPGSVPALMHSLRTDADGTVRGHAAWALGRIATAEALKALEEARKIEVDPAVLAEIEAALIPLGGTGSGDHSSAQG